MQLDLFQQDLHEELKATKKWMERLEKRVLKLERSIAMVDLVKKSQEPSQLQWWGT